ncbi:MAG: alpha/beta hydrolase, partial [Gemmatimonadaceae bacterium]
MIGVRYALLLPCLASACSPLRVAENLLSSGQTTRSGDIAYGSDSRQRLDVYRPRARGNPAPVVVFLYGGRWQSGSKDQYRLLGDALARRGVVVVVPDYRLYPKVKFPRWVEDAAQALKWTRNNIARLGGDTAQVWVVGHSSGAHTAVLLALDDHYLRDTGLPASAVRGYVSIAGLGPRLILELISQKADKQICFFCTAQMTRPCPRAILSALPSAY